jgi:hypothetical protein
MTYRDIVRLERTQKPDGYLIVGEQAEDRAYGRHPSVLDILFNIADSKTRLHSMAPINKGC